MRMLSWFFKADKGVDLAIRWVTVYVAVSAAWTWLTKNVSWFGTLTWPEAIFLALAFSLMTMLVSALALAAGAWGFRLLRPVPAIEAPAQDPPRIAVPYDDSFLRTQIDKLNEGIRSIVDQISPLVRERAEALQAAEAAEHLRIAVANEPHMPQRPQLHGARYNFDFPKIIRGAICFVDKNSFEGNELSLAMDKEEKKILNDVRFLQVPNDELHIWQDEYERRDWLIFKAKYDLLMKKLRRLNGE